MKNIILGLLVGLIISFPISVYAKAVMNPAEKFGKVGNGDLYTTKITTEEGLYRIFVYNNFYGSGVAAIRIK